MANKTAREGRKGSTYKMEITGHSESQPNQRIPKITGSGNARKEYDAHQGERPEEAEASTTRKPGQ